MRVLFIANNQSNDFLSDAVFHGLANLPNVEIMDYHPLWYMYDDIDQLDLLNRFHGRGFTYYASLPAKKVDRTSIERRIQSNYFDKVVYGNIRRCLDLFELVQQHYDKDSIILLDGNDEHNQPGVWDEYVDRGVYYMRELSPEESEKYPSVRPIHFAFPADKIVSHLPQKEKVLAHIIPGVASTFVFNDERSYLTDYQSALFGYTWRKAGWDCLRHYEILGSGCIPLFLDIHHCPDTICTAYPKKLLKEYYDVSGLADLFTMRESMRYDDRRCLIVDRDLTKINDLDINEEFFSVYFSYLEKLLDYARQHNTTTTLAQYILQ